VSAGAYDQATKEIVRQRRLLEAYISRHPEFQAALTPVCLLDGAPVAARLMAAAAENTGLGPMASVAGTLAQLAAEKAHTEGCQDVVVENGGDIYLHSDRDVVIGIYAGDDGIAANLSFCVTPEEMPLAICSSSSRMGHSMSFGDCELATVLSADAALADSAATLACNIICRDDDLEKTLGQIGQIPGIRGILAVKSGKIGLWGNLPRLTRNTDAATKSKVTRDKRSQVI